MKRAQRWTDQPLSKERREVGEKRDALGSTEKKLLRVVSNEHRPVAGVDRDRAERTRRHSHD
jgi:hypothetical protein